MNYKELVKKHYKKEAKKGGLSLTSTMADANTRRLEIENIVSYLKSDKKCLEVGCGNGAASVEISKSIKIDLTCVDFSEDMIKLAKRQPTDKIKGKVKFKVEDVLRLKYKSAFDFIFTERCIINLMNWNDQKEALKNIATSLRAGGKLILLEAFNDGFEELNNCRREVGLEPLKPAYHNFYLDKERVIGYLKKQKLKFVQENNFLSSYFFGSRVLYPVFAKAGKKDIKYNASFVKYFSLIPSFGNYSQTKILLFSKVR